MAGTIRPRLSAGEGRRFAFTLAAAFAVLGAFLWWRHSAAPFFPSAPSAPSAPYALLLLSAVLFASGALIPTRLGPVQRAWMGLAHAISRITTPIFMAVIYFLVIAPMGLLLRVLGRNPLSRTAINGSFWVTRSPAEQRSDIERQF